MANPFDFAANRNWPYAACLLGGALYWRTGSVFGTVLFWLVTVVNIVLVLVGIQALATCCCLVPFILLLLAFSVLRDRNRSLILS